MKGDDQNPGAGRGKVTLATVRPKTVASVCEHALSSMMIANMYANARVPGFPRATYPERARSTTQPRISPASHVPKVNVGMGHQPSFSRSASTVGL